MANPLPASFLNFPIVDPKTGQATVDFTRWLTQVISQLANLTLDGNLNAGTGQQIDPATLAKQIANLDSNGIVMPNGIDLSRSYVNKYLDYINDGVNGGRFANRWFFLSASTSTQWYKLGTWVAGNYGDVLRLDCAGGAGFNTNSTQQSYAEIVVRSGDDATAPNLSGISWYQNGGTQPILAVKAAATGGSTSPSNRSWDIYIELLGYANSQFEAILTSGSTFTFSGATASDPGSASSTVVVGTGGAVLGSGGTGLDVVLDGNTYQRMPASNMDSNRRALIDFTQTGHIGKALANVPDDSNGGRFANRWFFLSASTSTQWYKLGTWVAGNYGDVLRLDCAGGAGFNTNGVQQSYAEIVVRSGDDAAAPNLSGISWYESGGTQPILSVKAAATGGSTAANNRSWDIYIELVGYANSHFEAILTPGSTFTFSGATASDPGGASSTVVVGTGGAVLGAGGTGLDTVLDGNTYARPLAYSLYKGNPYYRTARAAILSLSPTHYWPLDNTGVTDIGSSPSNLSSTGTIGSAAMSLAPGDPVVGTYTSNGSAALWGTATAATTWTIMSWVLPGANTWANTSGIIGRSNATPFGSPTAYEPHLFVDSSGYVYAGAYTGATSIVKSSSSPNWTIPHHLAATFTNGTLTLYIDGIQAAQATGLSADSPGTENIWTVGTVYGASWPSPLTSGWNTNSKGTNFQDVAVWEGTALIQSQIQNIVSSGAGQFRSLSSVLDDYYLRMPGSNMDSNRRALIDFSQSGHLYKTSDYIPSGTNTIIPTQTRVNNSTDTSGNLLFKNTSTVGLTNGTAISSSIVAIPPSITITTHGYPVLILAMVTITAGTGGAASVIPYIYRDGAALVGSSTTGNWWFNAGSSDTKTFIYLDDAPTAASHTYELYGLAGGTVGSTVKGGFLTVFEFA
jgi:hypothetical protein